MRQKGENFCFTFSVSVLIYPSLLRKKKHRVVAQFGRALRSGRRGRRFKSCQPDHLHAKGPLRRALFSCAATSAWGCKGSARQRCSHLSAGRFRGQGAIEGGVLSSMGRFRVRSVFTRRALSRCRYKSSSVSRDKLRRYLAKPTRICSRVVHHARQARACRAHATNSRGVPARSVPCVRFRRACFSLERQRGVLEYCTACRVRRAGKPPVNAAFARPSASKPRRATGSSATAEAVDTSLTWRHA